MANKSVKVILDTNLWISFLITKDFSKLNKLIFEQKIQLIFSEELLNEFIAVASRPKLKKYFSKTDLAAILKFLDSHAELINVKSKVKFHLQSGLFGYNPFPSDLSDGKMDIINWGFSPINLPNHTKTRSWVRNWGSSNFT
ncbi:MAG TPA: putative toxin-antitoxin system toxin component, PIN family [Bacteroidia bacterium]|nr:putative toxin-antitoxin system toxin component, PIN family [Bacteroidia bacterium]